MCFFQALEKSKYEQSLETVRRFIAISEKELELYYRHVALYGDPNTRNSDLVYDNKGEKPCSMETGISDPGKEDNTHTTNGDISEEPSDSELDSEDDMVTGDELDSDDELTEPETDSEGQELSETELDVEDKGTTQGW